MVRIYHKFGVPPESNGPHDQYRALFLVESLFSPVLSGTVWHAKHISRMSHCSMATVFTTFDNCVAC